MALALSTVLSWILAATTQHAASSDPIWSGDPFDSDLDTFRSGGAQDFGNGVRKARAAWDRLAPGQCPKPTIIVTTKKGDDLFQKALAEARVQTLTQLLGGDASRFRFEARNDGSKDTVDIDTSVTDTKQPTVLVDPPSGTKVKKGEKLKIKVTATEPDEGWQAGIKQIQIEDLDRHTHLSPWDNPSAAPQPCGHTDLTKTVERDYQVPDVPVARLKVKARDYHNQPTEITVRYPTASVTGGMGWGVPIRHANANGRQWGNVAITLDYDSEGNVTGTLSGEEFVEVTSACSMRTVTPVRHLGKLTGQYTPSQNRLSFQIEDAGSKQGTYLMSGPCPAGPYAWGAGWLADPKVQQHLRDLRMSEDGRVEKTFEVPYAGTMVRLQLTLMRAQN
jgi:hypothetical protein